MKPIENEKQLPEPDRVDEAAASPAGLETEGPDIAHAGDLDDGEEA